MLHPLLHKIWEQETVPEVWKKGHLVKLPKKGDPSPCNNWRGIMLLSIPGKVLARIMLGRLKTALDNTLREEQAGFHQDRSCTDHIATMGIIIEQSMEWQTPLYAVLIHFQKAFDSVDRDIFWRLMHTTASHTNVSIIQQLYEDTTRQVSTADQKTGIQWIFTKQLENLDFADDISILSHKQQDAQGKLCRVADETGKTGLQINTKTTEVMRLGPTTTWTGRHQGNRQVCRSRCLRRLINIRWPDVIPNSELWNKTKQVPIYLKIRKRKCTGLATLFESPRQTSPDKPLNGTRMAKHSTKTQTDLAQKRKRRSEGCSNDMG
ncbi:uncharacterized protein LOC130050469 [Ostrea edulis]|uniref:uncharacterized protein LOC130050469 n=1 Tax=Ostrea edulis TaxID=37623 RepID=UPI0024AFD918|nr:uncharacterized protein LOC130050469 [Ostrea edulis]